MLSVVRARRLPPRRSQRGATLIEILVSLLILMFGLLGLIGVMVQSQRAQLESYQRVQALLLVQDMVARINTNRVAADCYVQAAAMGTGNNAVPDASACGVGTADQKTRATQDLTEWKSLLLGSAEVSGGSNVGAMLGARGCITKDAATGVFQVAVVWQGSQTVGAPPAGITCGQGSYGADDAQRRAVSVTILPSTST
ncbi:type IV pilus modification protein PilV [Ramlibacter sp.]|uniref:type IV pilus modification protein PilV n=1 Tax=Ramlibacter sp. TaxID=1917967 RepID=UPI002FC69B7D